MKVKNIVKSSVLGLVLIGSSAIANDDSFFVGLEVGNLKYDVTLSANAISMDSSDNGGYQAIRVGKNIGAHRVYATINRVNSESDVDMGAYGLNYDYMFMKEQKLNPFVGLYVSKYSYEESGGLDSGFNKDKIELDGNIVGLHIGTDYQFNDNHGINFGLRMSLSASGSDTFTHVATNTDVTLEMDKQRQVYFGYTYSF
jgi:hypothetical protein